MCSVTQLTLGMLSRVVEDDQVYILVSRMDADSTASPGVSWH